MSAGDDNLITTETSNKIVSTFFKIVTFLLNLSCISETIVHNASQPFFSETKSHASKVTSFSLKIIDKFFEADHIVVLIDVSSIDFKIMFNI